MKDDQHYLEICLNLARKAKDRDEVPVGALIVDSHSGQILSRAYNLKEKLQSPLGHAEVLAIHRACQKLKNWRLTGYTLFSSLEPCVMCSGVIVQARLDRVVYSAIDPKGGGQSLFELLKNSKLNHRLELSSGNLEKPSQDLLQGYFKAKRKL